LLVAAIVVVVIAVVALLLILVGPSRQVRAEPPLPDDVQARILLGESPEEVEAELEEEEESSAGDEPPRAS
jgi:hypothetical protein